MSFLAERQTLAKQALYDLMQEALQENAKYIHALQDTLNIIGTEPDLEMRSIKILKIVKGALDG